MSQTYRLTGIFVLLIALAAASAAIGGVKPAGAEEKDTIVVYQVAKATQSSQEKLTTGDDVTPWFPIPDDFLWICETPVFECKTCEGAECQSPAGDDLVARTPETVAFIVPLDFLWLCDGWVFECTVVCVGNDPCLEDARRNARLRVVPATQESEGSLKEIMVISTIW
jgi:hypothetical protein